MEIEISRVGCCKKLLNHICPILKLLDSPFVQIKLHKSLFSSKYYVFHQRKFPLFFGSCVQIVMLLDLQLGVRLSFNSFRLSPRCDAFKFPFFCCCVHTTDEQKRLTEPILSPFFFAILPSYFAMRLLNSFSFVVQNITETQRRLFF